MQPVNRPFPSIQVIEGYQQNSDLFLADVVEFCKERETEIERRIQSLPHNAILTADKETHFTELVNTYLSGDNTDYPRLNRDEATLKSSSNATHIEVLYTIPWTGNASAFSFKPTEEFAKPSSSVIIHLDDFDRWKSLPSTTDSQRMTTRNYSSPNSKNCSKTTFHGL